MTNLLLALSALAVVIVLVAATRAGAAEPPATGKASPLDFTLKANDGTDYALAQHKGKVLLLVNVASKCGYTKQYTGLQQLWTTYKDKGLVLIGIPSNDFMGQEPGTDAEIATFCSTKFGVTFPLMAKIDVKGDTQAPLYTYLTRESPTPGKVGWNFNKYLVGRDGVVIAHYESKVAPDNAEFIAALEKALAAPVPAAPTAH